MKRNIDNLFVSYEIASELKELGFDDPCIAYFRCFDLTAVSQLQEEFSYYLNQDGRLAAPTYQQVQDWLREEYDLNICVCVFTDGTYEDHMQFDKERYPKTDYEPALGYNRVKEYYTAYQTAIKEAIKIIKQHKI